MRRTIIYKPSVAEAVLVTLEKATKERLIFYLARNLITINAVYEQLWEGFATEI